MKYQEKIFIRCPYCGDSIKHKDKCHLEVSLIKALFYCYRCGTGGVLSKLLMDFPNIELPTEITIQKQTPNIPALRDPDMKHLLYLQQRGVLDFIQKHTTLEIKTFYRMPEYVGIKGKYLIQGRLIKGIENKPKYLTYKLDEDIDAYWDTVDFMSDKEKLLKNLMICEGFFDLCKLKIFFSNSRVISLVGQNLNIHIPFTKNIKRVYFCFDKDVNISKYYNKVMNFLVKNNLNDCQLFYIEYGFNIKDAGEMKSIYDIKFRRLTDGIFKNQF